MKSVRLLIHVVLLIAFSPSALAVISVGSLNYPVWAERGEQRVPLAPGDRLQAGDVVHTGGSGRVWLQVEGGNVIKLGQNARLAIERAGFDGEGDDSVLRASFHLMRGALRFTSRFFELQRPVRHEFAFKLGAVTVSLDGTDILGRAAGDADSVALLEGRIEVTSAGHSATLMDKPLTVYRKTRGIPAEAVVSIDAAKVEDLVAETELDPSRGLARVTGNYVLVLQSLSNTALAEAELDRMRQAGYAVRARLVEVDGKSYTRIQLEGLAYRSAAENLRRAMIDAALINDAWIGLME
jgi:hypothetical protein